MLPRRGSLGRAWEKDHRQREAGEKGKGGDRGRERERKRKWQGKSEKECEGERQDTEEGPRERKFVGARRIEKVRNLIRLRVCAARPPPSTPHHHLPPLPPLPLQMEVNVKQSLLLVSGGINSLERDWAAREVNAGQSAQPPTPTRLLQPPLYFFFPFRSRGAACCIPTLHAPSPGQRRERSESDMKAFFFVFFFLEAQ